MQVQCSDVHLRYAPVVEQPSSMMQGSCQGQVASAYQTPR